MGPIAGHPPFAEILWASRIVWSESYGLIEVDWSSPVMSARLDARLFDHLKHPILDGRIPEIVGQLMGLQP